MDWLEVTVPAAPSDVETVADVLRRYSLGGVSIEEPLHTDGDEVAVDPCRPALVRAYLRRDERLPSQRRALRRDLSRLALDVALPRLRGRWVREEDWAEAWKRHFHIERVGRRLVVSPRWRQYHPRLGEIVIRLDPGMAFGTGQHPTTRMCLLALERHLFPGCRLLDLGTGTGILAIAAAGLGAGEVIALDTDELAVNVARDNLAANAVDGRVRVALGSLGGAWPLSDPYRGAFDRLVANISSAAVIELAPEMVSSLKKGGIGIAGGISDQRCDECRRALREAGANIIEVMSESDWRALVFEA